MIYETLYRESGIYEMKFCVYFIFRFWRWI